MCLRSMPVSSLARSPQSSSNRTYPASRRSLKAPALAGVQQRRQLVVGQDRHRRGLRLVDCDPGQRVGVDDLLGHQPGGEAAQPAPACEDGPVAQPAPRQPNRPAEHVVAGEGRQVDPVGPVRSARRTDSGPTGRRAPGCAPTCLRRAGPHQKLAAKDSRVSGMGIVPMLSGEFLPCLRGFPSLRTHHA